MKVPLLIVLSLALAACDSSAPTDTYPPAGRYNVDAYVSSISECPPDVACLVPDHFTAVASLDEEPRPIGVMIFANQPSQLRLDGFYRFSVEVAAPSETGRAISLLGYAEPERFE